MNGKTLVLSLAAILVLAGSAFAWGGGQKAMRMQCPAGYGNMIKGQAWTGQGPRLGDRGQPVNRQSRWNDGRGMGVARFGGDVPEAIQEKLLEMRKVQHEMAIAMMEKDVDKAKVTALHDKKVALRNEISKWRFEQQLNRAAEERNPMMRGFGRQDWREGRWENRQEFRQQNLQRNQPNT